MIQERIEQAAREIAEDNEKCYIMYDGETETTSYKECRDSALEMAKWLLSHQWISVDEELPEKIKGKNYSKYVLARQEYYEHEHYVIARYDYSFNMWISTTYFKPEFITHWMNIPKLGGE